RLPRARRARRAAAALLLLGCLAGSAGCSSDEPALMEATRKEGGLLATLPSVALVGSPVTLRVAPLSELGTPQREWTGTLSAESTDEAMIAPPGFVNGAPGSLVLRGVIFRTPGIHRVTVRSSNGEVAIAGPVLVARTEEELRARPDAPARRPYWGDAHGHTAFGDGANSPDEYLYYGREVSALDYVCVSEHDFQQFLEVGLDDAADKWDRLVAAAHKWRRPTFAVLLGWEWSSREHGHRVVLFPDDETRYVSYREAPTPRALADALRGTGAVSVIAHPTGSKLTPAVNWESVAPGFDRAIEIYSGHGTMDAATGFRPTSEPKDGHSAMDAMRHGFDLAFVAFSDTHLSTPGNPWPPVIRDAPYPGGLTAALATGPTEREILDAIANGHCYATSGERFLIDMRVNDRIPGETVVLTPGTALRVRAFVAGIGVVQQAELLRGTEVLDRFEGDTGELSIDATVSAEPGLLWLRGRSSTGDRFWTSPVRVSRP
ncbi:CehA/McbA family metallohydrolase, partial [bacterium]|nr:CehA/McbA family metallohydrolase [bacterium]